MPPVDGRAPSIAELPLQTAWAVPRSGLFRRLSERLEARLDAERDQLPLFVPVALGLGISAWFALPDTESWIAFLLVSLALATGFVATGIDTRWGRWSAMFWLAAAAGCGLIWAKAERLEAPRLERPQLASFSATVESVQALPARGMVRLVLGSPSVADLPPRLRVNVPEKAAPPGLSVGAVVKIRAWLMPPAQMPVPGSYDFARAAWFQGIGATGRALDVELVSSSSKQGAAARIAAWRQQLAAHVRERLGGGGGAGIAAALATGDEAGIEEADAEAMRRSGLAHLLSVSGLHLTAVVGAVMLVVLKLLALSPALALRWPLTLIAAAVAGLAGVAYTLLTGAEVPTVRACVAALLILAGLALGRDAFTMRLLAVGALVVLLLWPESLAGPSFQLSFAAIAAIVALHDNERVQALLSRRDEDMLRKMARGIIGLILTGLAVELALTPIALFHFHKAGLYGAFANIVAIPLTTFVVMPLEALALIFDLVGLGAPFWWLTGQCLSFLLALAHATAAAPGAVAMLPSMPPAAFGLMLAGGLWLLLWRTGWRLWGLVPAAAGAVWALCTPAPHLIVTGDGQHLAIRTGSGELALLRPRAGEHVRSLLSESAGAEPVFADIDDLPDARCNRDLCVAELLGEGRVWRLLATRSPHFLDYTSLARACAAADIVVSDRVLPAGCIPRWLKADRRLLAQTGGISIVLSETPQIRTVAESVGKHPWAPSVMKAATAAPAPRTPRNQKAPAGEPGLRW